MDCNCININNGGAVFRHVYGNVLRMAIPLTVRTVELVDGEATATDADFIPSQDYPVEVILQRENRRAITIEATMRDGNIAYIEDLGTVPVGQYAITVMCKDDNGNPYRFKQNDVLNVVDTTAEAGIEKGIEYDVTVWYLDSAIYLVLKGEDGVGIEDIVTETSGEIGGTNTVTIILSDGRQKSFTVLNGSGAVDGDFNPNSNHPVSNSVITERFNAVDTAIAGLFGDVDYDSQTKSIRFYNKNKSAILATLDAKPFIKDGMVNSVYISNNTLVITFNTDAGREAIGVPLTSVFNPNNYYTKVQVDSRIATALDNLNMSNYYTKSQTDRIVGSKADVSNDGKVPASEATPVVLDYIYAPAPGPVIPINPQAGEVIYFANEKKIRRYYYEYAGQSGGLPAIVYVEETPSKHVVYYNKGNEKFYRYDAGSLSMVEIETGRGDGTVTGVKVGSTTYEPTDGVVDISAGIPDVDTAIAGLADVARTGDYDDLENKPTIPDVSNLATKSELQSKADASNVYTKSEVDNALALKQGNITDLEQIRAGATLGASSYQKPHSGIPASDLADGVIPDVSGFVTASDVADAVADLVDSAPATLDTLNELAAALGDDPNFATTMATALGNKVDKVAGKGLSTNDYTDAEKTKLEGLSNYDDTALQAAVAGKVDKESGKSLMTDAERTKLANLAEVATSGSYNDLSDKPVIENRQQVIVDINCGGYNFPESFAIDGNTITGSQLYSLCANPQKDVLLRIIGYDSDTDGNVEYNDSILYHRIVDELIEGDVQYFASWYNGHFLLVGLIIEEEGSSIYFDAGIEEYNYAPIAALNGKQDKLTFDNAPTQNSNNVVKSGGVYTALAGKQATLVKGTNLDATPTNGSDNPVTSDGVYDAIAAIPAGADGVTPHIDPTTGNWFIGTTNTGVHAQGPKGNSVVDGDTFDIVNNLTDGGEGDALSAEMGKVIRQNIMLIFNALGVYAFPEGKPILSWGSTVIKYSINVNDVTGSLTITDVEVDGSSVGSLPAQIVDGKSLSLKLTAPSGKSVKDDSVVVTMGGVDITNDVYTASTDTIDIPAVTGDIVIVATSVNYDAEIEYIQSSGTQWIDTGVVWADGYRYELKAEFLQNGGNFDSILGARQTQGGNKFSVPLAIQQNNRPYLQVAEGQAIVSNTTLGLYTFKGSQSGRALSLEVNGTTASGNVAGSATAATISLYMFARHRDDNVSNSAAVAKLYYCKIWNGNTLVRDFIPVRVGQVGQLYDKVSGDFFANIGTGSFTLGNDK